jgi:hypothetical protein
MEAMPVVLNRCPFGLFCQFPFQRQHLGAGLQSVNVVRPQLHHLPAFIQVFCSIVGSSKGIPDSMGKLMLDQIHPLF